MVEGGTPNTLLRRGVTKESLAIGTDVVVDGYQARDHTAQRANGRNITFADGRKLFLGSSGTGAPPTARTRPRARAGAQSAPGSARTGKNPEPLHYSAARQATAKTGPCQMLLTASRRVLPTVEGASLGGKRRTSRCRAGGC